MSFSYKHNQYGKTLLWRYNMSSPYCGHSCNTNNSYYPHKTLNKSWYCGMLHTSLRYDLLYNFKTYFGPKLSKYSIISLDIHDNPMWTTTYTTINIHNIILSYAYHSSDLWKTHPVNYFIIGQCFIFKLVPTRGNPLNGEFFPR